MQHLITRTMTMGDIVEQFPEVVETLLAFGVQCVGCHVSPYESLEDGFRGHGFSEEEISVALTKLNAVVEQERAKSKELPIQGQISLTPLAVAKVKQFCEQSKKAALRIAVKVGGCSGKEYIFDLAEKQNDTDIIIEQDGATICIDRESIAKLDGSILDYKEALTGAGFVLQNPNASKMCGCGKSFS